MGDLVRFGRVTVSDLNWPAVLKLMMPSMLREGVEAEDLRTELEEGTSQLWADDDLTIGCVTYVNGTPALHLHLVSGSSMRDWIGPLHEAIRKEANAAGFQKLSLTGRNAWKRWLAPMGYRQTGVILEMGL